MQITIQTSSNYHLVKTTGRLDANWSEYFTDYFLDLIRQGKHRLIIDASGMEFLSSAGIRALVRIAKELKKVNGDFHIFQATDFVAKTIEMTGFKIWLCNELPKDEAQEPLPGNLLPHFELFEADPNGVLFAAQLKNWKFPLKAKPESLMRLAFPINSFSIGIGSPSKDATESLSTAGEFMAVCGQLIFQPPELKSKPDYLLSEGNFIPEINALQAIFLQGAMQGLVRFMPPEGKIKIGLSELASEALALSKSNTAAILILAEAEGLVGAQLIHEVNSLTKTSWPDYPEIREWISFSGEKVFAGQQALVFGIVSQEPNPLLDSLLHPLPSSNGLKGHFHAAVFPYQALQNGNIDMQQSINKFLNGPPPLALLHLIDDKRAISGLGESAFVRGACWFSPVKFKEEKL